MNPKTESHYQSPLTSLNNKKKVYLGRIKMNVIDILYKGLPLN